jgi:hypothetical protein
VPLEEIHDLVTQLWSVEVVDRARFGFQKMQLRDTLSDAVNLFGPEPLERFFCVILANPMVLGISTKQTRERQISLICRQQVLVLAKMAMESSVAATTRDGRAFQQTTVASVRLLL